MGRGAQLARRRAALVARSAAFRSALAVDGARIGARLALVDKGVAAARKLAGQPELLAGAAALLLALRPLRAMKWAARGALLFSVGRRVLGALNRARAGHADRGEPPTCI
jgi:YqjK-like protein